MKKYSFIFLLLFFGAESKAQLSPGNIDTLTTVRTAENLISGNTKDILTSFFQLAANDLTGNNKEFKFSSSIFALMLKSNPSLNMDKRYFTKSSFARRTEINWAIKLDSNYKFNGASFGAKWAFVNKRDLAVSKAFISEAGTVLAKDFNIHKRIIQLISATEDTTTRQLTAELREIIKDTTGKAYSKMSPELKIIYMQAVSEFNKNNGIPAESFYAAARASFDNLKKGYANKPIIVGGFDLKTFKDQFLFSDISLYIDGSGGIFQTSSNEFDIDLVGKLVYTIQDDSTKPVRDLTRNLLHGEAGFNLVFRNKVAQSVFEIKLTAGYDNVFSGRYAGEDEKLFTLNGTARIHITKDISIPMTIKYDPDHSNVLGLLSVTTNFDGLSKLLASKN